MSPAVRVSKQVLVLGVTSEAHRASRELAQLGYSVDWVPVGGTIVPDDLPSNVSVHSDCTLVGFAGEAGAFSATLRRDGKRHDLSPSAVIVATGNERYYPGERLGLALSDRMMTVSQLLSQLEMPQEGLANPPSPATILFVLDYGGQTPKETATEALTAAVCARQVWDAEVYVFYGDLKVDTPGLERLTREMRDCGILFCRYGQANLVADGNGVTVSYEEGTVQGDLLALPEAVRPRPDTAELAALLDVRLGEDGFYQDINIRQYRPGLASRRAS
ncbi:MAG: hypothetical protein FJZ90_18165, partial [Chloroflexi bacterium]|nr:hypothetical protein [Chloroflexota bacterium]